MKCTCPTMFDDRTRAIVRAGLDQFCQLHGTRKHEMPHCASCTCGAVPIVQTPATAARDAMRAEADNHSEPRDGDDE